MPAVDRDATIQSFPRHPAPTDGRDNTNRLSGVLAEELLNKIVALDLRVKQIIGPQDELNPKKPGACKSVPGQLGTPSLDLIERLLPSVGTIVFDAALAREPDGSYSIPVELHGTAAQLCPGECFADHFRFRTGSILGTCLLVRSNVVLTAKHVLSAASGAKLRVVFGHSSDGSQGAVSRIPSLNVFEIGAVVSESPDESHGDWVFVALTSSTTRPVLNLRGKAVSMGEPLFKIGHPFGLPAITAGNATVNGFYKAFFYASLDASGGDSGAPVFDSQGQVVGVFKGGGVDFHWRDQPPPPCNFQLTVSNPLHPGQLVTPVTLLRLPAP